MPFLGTILSLFGLTLNFIASMFFVFKKLNKLVTYFSPYHKALLYAYNKFLKYKKLEEGDEGFNQLLESLGISREKYKNLRILNGKIYGAQRTFLIPKISSVKDENTDLILDINLLTTRVNESFENKRRQYGFKILLLGFLLQVISIIISLWP